jgi:UDP-N-acetylmuramate dehydrogenase
LEEAREGVLQQRRNRGMVLDADDHDTWSCGSFFTNPILSTRRFDDLERRAAAQLGPDASPPRFADTDGNVKTSAAWLIDKAGFAKGFSLPGSRAALSGKHTLAITNRGGATASDVAELARHLRDGVHAAFGVTLVNEPVFVGHDL